MCVCTLLCIIYILYILSGILKDELILSSMELYSIFLNLFFPYSISILSLSLSLLLSFDLFYFFSLFHPQSFSLSLSHVREICIYLYIIINTYAYIRRSLFFNQWKKKKNERARGICCSHFKRAVLSKKNYRAKGDKTRRT